MPMIDEHTERHPLYGGDAEYHGTGGFREGHVHRDVYIQPFDEETEEAYFTNLHFGDNPHQEEMHH